LHKELGGIRLRFKRGLKTTPDEVDKNQLKWRSELINYMATAKDDEAYVNKTCVLSPENIEDIKNMFSTTNSFLICVLKPNHIKVVKLNAKLIEASQKSVIEVTPLVKEKDPFSS